MNLSLQIARLKDGLNVGELFHGPTLTFKDLALSVVGQLYEFFLKKRNDKVIVLVGNENLLFLQYYQISFLRISEQY